MIFWSEPDEVGELRRAWEAVRTKPSRAGVAGLSERI